MEKLDLHRLGLFMEEEIILVPEEAEEILQKEKLKSKFPVSDEEIQATPEQAPIIDEGGQSPEIPVDLPEIENEVGISYEGEYEKGLLVIFQGTELEDEHRDFLIKILGAVSYSLKDIALVASTQMNGADPENLQRLAPHKIMVFGQIHHPISQFKTTAYEIVNEDETEYLFADDLSTIAGDKSLKKKLWESLQLFFNIKK